MSEQLLRCMASRTNRSFVVADVFVLERGAGKKGDREAREGGKTPVALSPFERRVWFPRANAKKQLDSEY